ncbi:MAG TPA: tetratricopeptide repeat protein [Myxococcaceae bacterium]|jgi:tetratricopeptide (TPR) repeat protein
MPPTPSKTLSPAELAKLEHAFATEPASGAYKPLAEAYLGMGRFMEAMVVCKKGVKAHPNAADPRVLLARVYAEQGKDKKALEELAGAMQVAPADKNVLRMTGALQLKGGEADAGKANLLKAWEVDPEDKDTEAALKQFKIEPPRPAPPEPEPPPEEPIPEDLPTEQVSVEADPPVIPPEPKSGVRRPSTAPAGPPPPLGREPTSGARRPPNGAPTRAPQVPARPPSPQAQQARGPARPPARPASPPQVTYRPPDEDDAADDEESGSRARPQASEKEKKKSTRATFIALMALLPLTLGGYYFVGQYRARNNRERNRHLAAAAEQLKHDSYDSYQKAIKEADAALGFDASSGAAHAYLAYANAIRWGEHGGGDAARTQAEENLGEAKKSGEVSAYLYSAEALIKTYGGKGAAALAELEERVKAFDAKGSRSPLMYLTLGLIQMNAGDLEHARENLEIAQGQSPDDPRIYAALGRLQRQRGEDSAAWKSFDFALRYERDHHESLLGKALLMLDQDNPNYETAAKMLKKLTTADPRPSTRQLAAAQLGQALLISRVTKVMPNLAPDVQKQLSDATGVSMDAEKAKAEILKVEKEGLDFARIDPELHLIRARRLRSEGQLDQAINEVREAIKADSSRAHFHIELAKVLMEKPGGERDAQTALLTAIKTMGESPKILVMLGDAYRRQGKTDDAIAQYSRALSDPKAKNPEARMALGGLYREKKDWARAESELSRAAQDYVGQTYKLASASVELGRLWEDKGDRTKAEETFKKAIEADSEFAPGYFFLGKFYASDRKTFIAGRTSLQKYLQMDPRGAYADEARRILQ